MKLTVEQRRVLANKIYKELAEPINKENENIRNSSKYKNFIETNADCKKIAQILEKYGFNDRYEYVLEHIRARHFENQFKEVNFSSYEIEQALILQTIECSNLEEIINAVKTAILNK